MRQEGFLEGSRECLGEGSKIKKSDLPDTPVETPKKAKYTTESD